MRNLLIGLGVLIVIAAIAIWIIGLAIKLAVWVVAIGVVVLVIAGVLNLVDHSDDGTIDYKNNPPKV